jgi:small-conductance mechanosensitive channel
MMVGLFQAATCLVRCLPALLCLVMLYGAPALAAAPPANPPASTTEDLQKLVATLKDDQQREQLIKQLQTMIAAQEHVAPPPETPGDLISQATAKLQQLGDDLVDTASVLVDVPRLMDWVETQAADAQVRERWLRIAQHIGEILGAAILVDLLVRLAISGLRKRLAREAGLRWGARVARLVTLLIVDALPIAAFALAGYIMLPIVRPQSVTATAAPLLISAVFTARILQVLARTLLLTPREIGWNLLPMSEESANYLVIWVRRFLFWVVYGFALAMVAWDAGAPGAVVAVLQRAVALVLTVLGVVFILQNRQSVATWLRPTPRQPVASGAEEGAEAILADPVLADPALTPSGSPPRRRQAVDLLRHRVADLWHILVIVYIIGIFAVYALRVENGFSYLFRATLLSLAIIAVARVLIRVVTRVADRGFAIPEDLRHRFPTLESRTNRYLPILNIVASTAVWAVALLSLMEAWDISSFAWLGSDVGRRVISALVTVASIVAFAFLLWEVINAAIDRYLAGGIVADGGKIARSARMRTLLPLLRNVLWVVLLVVVVLVVLSELGVNIAPLLGISAVAGVAIGFGSQALVKDIITGMFILIEDTMAVGDVVDFGGGFAGVVEGMSIRTVKLRDGQATLQVIPFSDITKIKNLSRDYAYHVIELALPFGMDPDAVSAILKAIGEEMRADPAIGPLMAEPLEVVGLTTMGLDGYKLQARIKTLPLKQWRVQQDFNRRLKKAFDAAGITPPGAGQTISFDPKVVALLDRFSLTSAPQSSSESSESSAAGSAAPSTR